MLHKINLEHILLFGHKKRPEKRVLRNWTTPKKNFWEHKSHFPNGKKTEIHSWGILWQSWHLDGNLEDNYYLGWIIFILKETIGPFRINLILWGETPRFLRISKIIGYPFQPATPSSYAAQQWPKNSISLIIARRIDYQNKIDLP